MASQLQQDQNLESSQIFTENIQVLAIDANPVSLRIHRALLEKCKYKVITRTDPKDALQLLRQPENKIDLVLSHVVRHDNNMDGLELLETISSSEIDIPVALVSARDDMDYVMRSLRYGASDYLTKPVRLSDLKKLWYHVFKKTTLGTPRKPSIPKNIIQKQEEAKATGCEEDQKKEESETSMIISNKGTSSCNSRRRISWTPDLHAKFLDAIKILGTKTNKIHPLDILEQMNVPGLTRQNVASHLQKYRLNLSKLKNENKGAEENVLAEDKDKKMQLVVHGNPKPEENISSPNTNNKWIHWLRQLAPPPSQQMVTVASIQPSHIICNGQTVHDQRKQNLASASTFQLLNNPIVPQALRWQDFGYIANNPSHLSFQQSHNFPNYSYSSPNSFSSASHLVEAAASPQMGAFSPQALATMPPLQNFSLAAQHGEQHAIDFVQSGGESNMRGNPIDCTTNNMQLVPAAPLYMLENDQARLEQQFNQETLLRHKSFSDSDLNERIGLNASLVRTDSYSDLELNELLRQFYNYTTPQLP